jgi:hypothetical protein
MRSVLGFGLTLEDSVGQVQWFRKHSNHYLITYVTQSNLKFKRID